MANKNQHPQKSEALNLAVVAEGLARAVLTDSVTKGTHSSEYLRHPQQSPFGDFDKRVTYIDGCMPLEELAPDSPVERTLALSFQMRKSDGSNQVVVIGKTPAALDPSRGGRQAHDPKAGAPGEYLMVAYDADAVDGGPVTSRYVDAAEMAGVRASYGGPIEFAPSHDRGRSLVISGELEQAVGLVNTQPLPEVTR